MGKIMSFKRMTLVGWSLFFIPFCLFVSLLFSCETDAYDKGEGDYSLIRAELVDMHVDANKKADYFETDSNDRLTVDNPFTTKTFTTPDSIYRMALYYKETDAEHAEVFNMSTVAVLHPRTFKADAMKTDPVSFESAWMSQNHRYLNASIYLKLGSTTDEDAIQKLGVQTDTLMQNADNTRTLHLCLFHDQAGVPEYYSQRVYVSIPLQHVDADSLVLNINTYSGMVKKFFKL